jgi:hypothetical protein
VNVSVREEAVWGEWLDFSPKDGKNDASVKIYNFDKDEAEKLLAQLDLVNLI